MNNAVAHLKHNVNRVVILDIDLHHGKSLNSVELEVW